MQNRPAGLLDTRSASTVRSPTNAHIPPSKPRITLSRPAAPKRDNPQRKLMKTAQPRVVLQ